MRPFRRRFRRFAELLPRLVKLVGHEQRGKQQVLRLERRSRAAQLSIFLRDHRTQRPDMRFLPIRTDDGVALGANAERNCAHGVLVFQLRQKFVEFTKAFRDLLAQLLVDVDEFNHLGRAAPCLAVRAKACLARSVNTRHRAFDAGQRGCDAVCGHGG